MHLFRSKREVPSLNTTATADISFMLLILFLVTTSMDADKGLQRQLPPMDNREEATVDVSKGNILQLELTADNQLIIDEKTSSTKQLRQKVIDFVENSRDREHHIISLKANRDATYEAYFNIQNEIVSAYRAMRNRAAKQYYHRSYDECTKEQREKLRQLYPQRIAEGYGGN